MRIVQIVNSLNYGDGVCNDVLNKNNLLKKLGYNTLIYARYHQTECLDLYNSIEDFRAEPTDIILHHYAGKSYVQDEVMASECVKVLIYHNITPPEFFDVLSDEYTFCMDGIDEVKKIAKDYNYILGVSQFNLDNLIKLGIQGDMDVIPNMVCFDNLKPYKLKNAEREKLNRKNFLFVGRIAPNKKQEDVISIFNYYYCNINADSKLTFVGNYAGQEQYYNTITEHLSSLRCCGNVEFTGKVSDDELYNHYSEADIFICMSEHEGFGIPLVESMYCGIPTIAYDSCAVKSTMGGAGVLVLDKQPEKIAKLCHTILTRNEILDSIIQKQNSRVEAFSEEKISEKLKNLIIKWSKGSI